MEGAKWKSTVLEISMNSWQLEFHPTEFQFYQINSGYGVVRSLVLNLDISSLRRPTIMMSRFPEMYEVLDF